VPQTGHLKKHGWQCPGSDKCLTARCHFALPLSLSWFQTRNSYDWTASGMRAYGHYCAHIALRATVSARTSTALHALHVTMTHPSFPSHSRAMLTTASQLARGTSTVRGHAQRIKACFTPQHAVACNLTCAYSRCVSTQHPAPNVRVRGAHSKA